MTLYINNLTSSTRTYLSSAVSVPANGSTQITSTVQQLALATDGGLRSDINTGLASVGDGTNNFGNLDAVTYLYELVLNLGPQSDGSGNLITSTSVSGKQALDINVTNANVTVNTKTVRTFSAPQTASVGTSSTLILSANTNRKGLYLSNTTAYQISFGFDGNAANYQYGLTLFPGEKFWMDEYSFSQGAIYAISSVATYIGYQEIT